jgi:hypothetical protein
MDNKISRKNDIEALISTINSQCLDIESLYRLSLSKKEIDSLLKIKIKNFLENARSILDFCAHDIAGVYQLKSKRGRIYFPIVAKDKNLKIFEKHIEDYLTDLKLNNPTLWDYLESIQPYHSDYVWLGYLVTIANENKHDKLTSQTKEEVPLRLVIECNGGVIKIPRNSYISLGENCSITIGDKAIPGGQILSPSSEQVRADEGLSVKKEIWVDFKFVINNDETISALELMDKIRSDLPKIIEKIYGMI